MKFIILIVCIIGSLTDISFSASVSTIEELDVKQNYRLNDDIVPIDYTIEVTPYFDNNTVGKKAFTFDGIVIIQLKALKSNVSEITLHYDDLIIKKKSLTTKPGYFAPFPWTVQYLTIIGDSYDNITNKYTLKMEKALNKFEIYTLNFEFTGNLQTDMHGFYRSSYTENGQTMWLASTQMQPVHARKVFPCFDEPKFKATFNIIINRPVHFQTSISNMPLASAYLASSNLYHETFQKTPPMSTYLVAFIVSEFRCRRNKKVFSVCARPDAYNQTEYSFDVGQQILSKYDDYFLYPYNKQMPKMAMAAIPDFSAGAMENWGLLTYRETALLYEPTVTTSMQQQRVASVVAHEQAHMWFGDLITCDWWSDTWLNEGFARFFEYFGTAMVESDWGLEQQFVVDQVHNVFIDDSIESSLPLSYDQIYTPDDIQDRFGQISYAKGGSVIRMLQHTIGHEKFQAALQTYIQTNALTTSVPEKLFAAFQNQTDDHNITEFMDSWVYKSGYPVIQVNVDTNRKTIVISQKRFLRDNMNHNDQTIYHVPITFATNESNREFQSTIPSTTLMKQQLTIEFGKPIDWIIFNVQQTGYYRVNYDNDTWTAIANVLNTSHTKIHALNRAQIVDDSLTLARANLLSYASTLNTIQYLQNEMDYVPWKAAFRNFDFILQRFQENNVHIFQEYILKLLNNAYEYLGFMPKPIENRLDIYNRANILQYACRFGHPNCIENARVEFDKFLNGSYIIPKDIASVVYCSVITEGSEKEWNILWNEFETVNIAAVQVTLLNSLGCTKDPKLIQKYFELILSDKVRLQDKHAAFVSTLTYQQNLDLVLDFIITKHKEIKMAFESDSEVSDMLSLILARATTNEQIDKAQKFADENQLTLKKKVKTSLESARYNLIWAKQNIPVIIDVIRPEVTVLNTNSAVTHTISFIVLLSVIALYIF